jgi:hypothetical protein
LTVLRAMKSLSLISSLEISWATSRSTSNADFLRGEVTEADPFLQWVAVRPDTLVEG